MIRVLLVEDSETDAAMTIYRMSRSARKNGRGVQIHHVETGKECMEHLRDPDVPFPDIIFLDLNMPEMDGREVLGEMKADGELHQITTVIMSSSALESDRAKAMALGANSYIVKPANEEEFGETMELVDRYWLATNVFPPKRQKKRRS